MIKKIKSIFSSELARGSLILIICTFIFNILNYFYHFSMARMLGPADYGVLASLFAIIYFFTIPNETIQTTIAKYTAIFKARQEPEKIKSLLSRSAKKCWKLGIIGVIIFILISPLIKGFLKLDSVTPLIIVSLIIFPILLLPIMRGALQGAKKFKELGINISIEGFIKLILSVFLVFLGFKVIGALAGVIIASFIAFLATFYFLREYLNKKEKYFDSKEIYSYSVPVFIAIICLTVMYSIDVFLAKHFFSEQDAGLYAVASLLGKMIFFALSPIAKAMFPVVAERKEKKENYSHILKKALSIVIAGSIIILILYYLFPQLILSILFGNQYLGVSNIIFYLGAAFSLMTISYVIVFYKLSVGKKKFVWLLPIFAIIEIVLLSLFNSSLIQFSIMFLVANFIMCLFLFLIRQK